MTTANDTQNACVSLASWHPAGMKKKTVTITMSAELKARIDAAARRESRSLASFVRRACELYAQDVEAKRTDPPARGEQ